MAHTTPTFNVGINIFELFELLFLFALQRGITRAGVGAKGLIKFCILDILLRLLMPDALLGLLYPVDKQRNLIFICPPLDFGFTRIFDSCIVVPEQKALKLE